MMCSCIEIDSILIAQDFELFVIEIEIIRQEHILTEDNELHFSLWVSVTDPLTRYWYILSSDEFLILCNIFQLYSVNEFMHNFEYQV